MATFFFLFFSLNNILALEAENKYLTPENFIHLKIHPFWGYYSSVTNPIYDQPKYTDFQILPPDSNQFHLGLFGNEIGLSISHLINSSPALQEALRKSLNIPEDKKFKLINFSLAGYQQPQHLSASVIYANILDAAILVEGCSETSYQEGIKGHIPSNPLLQLLFTENIQLLELRLKMMRFSERLKNLPNRPWPLFIKAFLRNYYKYSYTKARKYALELISKKRDKEFTGSSGLWLKSLYFQKSVFESMQIPFYVFYVGQPPSTEDQVKKVFRKSSKHISTFTYLRSNEMNCLSSSDVRDINLLKSVIGQLESSAKRDSQ